MALSVATNRSDELEEDLRKNEWRLRHAMESARLTYVEVDLVLGTARTPENFPAVMGYVPPTEQEKDISVGTRLLLAHVVPEDRARVAASHEEFAAGKHSGQLEYRVLGDDGIERWIETRWSVEVSVDGRPLKSFATNLDITERKRAEREVLQREERYRNLVTKMDEGYCVIEVLFDGNDRPVDYRYLEVNPSFESLTGMPNAVGKRVREFAPDLGQDWFDIFGKVARTGEPIRFANEAIPMNRWFDFYAFRVGLPEKRNVAIIFNNVTAQKRAEAALRESEERYRTLFTSIDEGFCIIEMIFDEHQRPVDYVFLEVNPTFSRQCGLTDVIGKRMRELIPDHEDSWFEHFGKVARTGDTARFVDFAKGLDPGRWFDIYACRVGGPDSRKVAVVFNDATERIETQEALRAGVQRLRFVMDSMPQKVTTATPDGINDYFSPQWMDFTGMSLEQIKDSGWTKFIHPEDLPETIRVWRHSLETGEASLSEQRFLRADGVYRWHLTRSIPLRDPSGKVMMWIGASTDVQEVKEADQHKDEFLGMLAHELRNPLAPVLNMLEVMKRAKGKEELIQPALETMERQLRHMSRLVDDLLDVSRISQGKISLRGEEIDLAPVLHQVVEAARPGFDRAQQELTVTLPETPVHLQADPVRLAQVFGNLLHNASKFSLPEGRIALTAVLQGDEVVVTVKDDGVGIAPEMLSKIFDLFAQADQTLERTRGGLGIGLTLVRRLTEMHDGSVKAFSRGAGLGSEFVVRLPVLAGKGEAPTLAPRPAVAEPVVMTPRRILVVDDNRDAANSLALALRLDGNETHLAFDGEEAVTMAESTRPDVILMDIGLPKLNGYGAAGRIREQPWGKRVILVALTGWGQSEDRRKTAEAGFDGHVVKPVDFTALKRLLARFTASAAEDRKP